jgi:hypothetical protein
MLDTDEKIAKFFFGFGLLLALGAMVLGPLDINSWSIACGVTASFVALAGMYFALQSWNEPDKAPPVAESDAKTGEGPNARVHRDESAQLQGESITPRDGNL